LFFLFFSWSLLQHPRNLEGSHSPLCS
jgi:hypothetical protein